MDGQLKLFDEAEQTSDIDLKAPKIVIPEHKRKAKITHEELFKGIPPKDEVITLPEDERICNSAESCLNTNAGRK